VSKKQKVVCILEKRLLFSFHEKKSFGRLEKIFLIDNVYGSQWSHSRKRPHQADHPV
jgi:hypothetical protein